jgi:hypothetical protein
MFFDDDYETDDTDELLASKMCEAPLVVFGTASKNDHHDQADDASCVVNDDWLFSIRGKPNAPRSSGVPLFAMGQRDLLDANLVARH